MKTETLATTPAMETPKRRKSFYRQHDSLIVGGTAVVLTLVAWETAWQHGRGYLTDSDPWISALFFTGPSAIWGAFRTTMASGRLVEDIVYSGTNFSIGFATALVAGVVAGIIIGWYRPVRIVVDPFLNAFYATPRIALVPLIIIWFGIGVLPGIVIVFLSAFFPILINTIVGVKTIDDDLLKAARSFCASDRKIFTTVALPGSVPFILTGVRQGVAHGLIGVVVGEMFTGGQGIGFMIAYSGQTFATERIFLGVVIMAGSGIILTSLAERLQNHFSRWRPER
jgi:ABC-type nitrate/sulfonate/bicarbonate transport system permease component